MSIKVMSEVWEHAPFVGTELLILLALADMANDDRECWPGLKHVAHKGRITVQQTQSVLSNLELQGVIEIVHRTAPGRGNISNLYRIKHPRSWDLLIAYEDDNPHQAQHTPLTKHSIPPSIIAEGENGIEPSLEPSLETEKKTPRKRGGVVKGSSAEYKRQEGLARHEATIEILLKKFKPDVDWTMIRPCDMTAKEIERYIEVAQVFEGFGHTAEDLPGMFKYLDSKGWPSYGVGKIAECAPDYAGYKTKHARPPASDNPDMDLSIPQPVTPILQQALTPELETTS